MDHYVIVYGSLDNLNDFLSEVVPKDYTTSYIVCKDPDNRELHNILIPQAKEGVIKVIICSQHETIQIRNLRALKCINGDSLFTSVKLD